MRRARVPPILCQDLWYDWDPYWIREVKARPNIKWIAVRITGLAVHDRWCGTYRIGRPADDDNFRRWSLFVNRTLPRRSLATAVIQPHHLPSHGNELKRGAAFRPGLKTYLDWPATMDLHYRLGLMLRMLRAETGAFIIAHVEDFAARWLLASDFVPDMWVMDTPMIGAEESTELWMKPMQRPGYMRWSTWPRMRHYRWFGMHLSPDDLIFSHLEQTRMMIGLWMDQITWAMPKPEPMTVFTSRGGGFL